ncbi:MAG: ribonuclease Z [Crocinitomicaceae bacterium]
MVKLTILGSGAATPTLKRGVTAQYLNFNERRILIDCGESTQLQFRKFGINFQRIQYIFISHLHGDHYLGLPGLLASMHLLGRQNDIHIFAPPELEKILKLQFDLTFVNLNFEIIYHQLTAKEPTLIFEDNNMMITALPLKHRIPCFGFIFKEKLKERSIIKDLIEPYQLTIPEMVMLKKGHDIEREGKLVSCEKLTIDPPNPKAYAFCTDTKYIPSLTKALKEVDVLYHEATFLESEKARAKATFHTTALQAATLAKTANVKQLLLGHFSARYKSTDDHKTEAQTIFHNILCVEDGDEILV